MEKHQTKRKRMVGAGMKTAKTKLVSLEDMRKKSVRLKMNQGSGVCLVWSALLRHLWEVAEPGA